MRARVVHLALRQLCGAWLCLCTAAAHAGTPLLTFSPITATTILLPVNNTTVISYVVTNQAAITQSWSMIPIQGVAQMTGGANECANSFILAHMQSCQLDLQVDGAQIGSGT